MRVVPDTAWRGSEGADRGAPRTRMYRGRGPTFYGVAFRMKDGRMERERCCSVGHAVKRVAIDHGDKLARKLST